VYLHREGRYRRRQPCVSVVCDDDVKPCVRRDVDVLTPCAPVPVQVFQTSQKCSLRFHDAIHNVFIDQVDTHIDAHSLKPDGLQGHDETVWNCDDHSTP